MTNSRTESREEFCLSIHMVSSLDGIIAKPDNSVAWFETKDFYEQGEDEEVNEILSSIDCYLMGARTYEHAMELSKHYGWPYGDKPTVVITHRRMHDDRPNVSFYAGDLLKLVETHLKPEYKRVWAVGGSALNNELLRLGLAQEIRISILPVLLGQGKLFFEQPGIESPLHLREAKAYRNGMVELCYEVKG